MLTYDPRYAGDNPPCFSSIIDKGVLVTILPFVDQPGLSDAISQDLTIFGRENRAIQSQVVGIYACPSDPGAPGPRPMNMDLLVGNGVVTAGEQLSAAYASYSANYGSYHVQAIPRSSTRCVVPPQLSAQADGVFNDLGPIRLASITDGLSHTIFVAEKATASFEQLVPIDPGIAGEYGWYYSGNYGDTLFTSFDPPNPFKKVGILASSARLFAASSFHPGGINVVMGDGSVRFLKDTIDTRPFDPSSGQPRWANQTAGGWWEGVPAPGV